MWEQSTLLHSTDLGLFIGLALNERMTVAVPIEALVALRSEAFVFLPPTVLLPTIVRRACHRQLLLLQPRSLNGRDVGQT